MEVFLYIVAFALLGVVVWQIALFVRDVKIKRVNKNNKKEVEPIDIKRDNQ